MSAQASDERSMLATDAIATWFSEVRAPLRESEHTTRAYRGDLVALLAVIAERGYAERGKCSVGALTIDDIAPLPVMRRAFGWWAENGPREQRRASSSIHRAHSTWTVFFAWLVAEGLVTGSPMAGVGKPERPEKLPKPFTPKAAGQIVETVKAGTVERRDPWPELERAVVITDLITGARTSELLGLNVEDVNRTAGQEGIRVTGKGNRERFVPVEAPVIALLGAYLDTRRKRFPDTARKRGVPEGASAFDWWDPKAPLFVDRRGERLRDGALRYMIKLIYRAAGVEAARAQGALTHALRHTAATNTAGGEGVTVFQLMALFGWKTLTTAQHYVDASGKQVREAAATNPVYGLLDG